MFCTVGHHKGWAIIQYDEDEGGTFAVPCRTWYEDDEGLPVIFPEDYTTKGDAMRAIDAHGKTWDETYSKFAADR